MIAPNSGMSVSSRLQQLFIYGDSCTIISVMAVRRQSMGANDAL